MATPAMSQNAEPVILCPEQKARLIKMIPTRIHSADGQLSMRLHMGVMLQELMKNFEARNIPIRTALLVGGAASHIVHEGYTFTDSDLEFEVKPVGPTNYDDEKKIFDGIRTVIHEFVRKEMEKAKFNLDDRDLLQKFVAKQVLIHNDTEAWNLISFHHADGANLEIKSVLRTARKYQFATDSLRIDLTPLLGDFGVFHVSSSYGDVKKVTKFLELMLIATKKPQEIYGGGVLKYCLLKTRGFQDTKKGHDLNKLRKKMANRFRESFMEGITTKFLQNHCKSFQIEEREKFLAAVDDFQQKIPDEVKIMRREIEHYNPGP